MTPALTIFFIILFLVPIGLAAYYRSKADNGEKRETELRRQNAELTKQLNQPQPESPNYIAYEFLKEIAQKNQFEIEEFERDEVWVTCGFEYQGGNFLCYAGAKNDELLLQFRMIAECPYTPENYEKVRSLCHHMTLQYRHLKFVYSYDENENNLRLHILVESIGPSEQAFMHYLYLCFRMANEVRQQIANEAPSVESDLLDARRGQRLLIDAEMAHEQSIHQASHPSSKAPNHGTLGEYIAYLFSEEKVEDLLSLTIQNGSVSQEIIECDKIDSYDVLSAIIAGTGEDAEFYASSPAVLIVDAATNHYVFTLHPLESKNNLLSVRMTAVCTPHEFLQNYVPNATYVPKAISMRLCYDKAELTSPDTETAGQLPQTDTDAQVKHGHQLMLRQCYLQAIAVLTPIFHQLRARFFKLSDKEKELFFSLCFYIGSCYSNLRLYDHAFYYLSMVKNCNRFDYSHEIINCLTNSGNPYIFTVLTEEEDTIRKQLEDLDKDDDRGTERMMAYRDSLVDYYAFLQRRRGHALITFEFLDEAESLFKELLNHEGSHEYAEKELKYIEQLRQNNNK